MSNIIDLFQATFIGLVTILPLANPLTTVVLFLSLAANFPPQVRAHEAKMTGIYVCAITIVAFYAGQLVMQIFGISIPGLRIAGGMIVAYIGFKMLFPAIAPENTLIVEKKTEELQSYQSKSIAFVPLAMPSTTGPGTIAMIISYSSTVTNGTLDFPRWVYWTSPVFIAISLGLIIWICLQSSGAILRFIGHSGIDAVSRIMGFLLVCMGIQFVINGVFELIHNYQ